jgi:hypothetical protein
MDFYASARKHGIAEDDAVHAVEHALVAAEDEEGLDVTRLRRRPGRPAMGDGPAETLPVRLDPALRKAVDERASSEKTTASEVVREALRRYLKVG